MERTYGDDLPEPFEDVALGAAVQQLLELLGGDGSRGGAAGRAGISSSFEREVSCCGRGERL